MARTKKIDDETKSKSTKKPNEPIYNRIIIAIDQKVAENLNDNLAEGIMEGLQESIFGTLEISHLSKSKDKEVDAMFHEYERWQQHQLEHGDEDVYDIFDYFPEPDFKLKDKPKVARALNGKKDIYTGRVDFELYDETIENIFNDIITAMEKNDKKNFKVIQTLKFDF